ncbi:acyltransferase family protein [Streptacidiphilus anmyonensis]|uniref:acyltransferase family protein n=1 Tax=Streptacidiphilus anmyonensis TaxID=405782 RepID=UPI001F3790C0|nr:acyltransferase [Streptacidiphilus anmyonensis]
MPAPEPTPSRTPPRLAAVDGLRLVAAAAVAAYHYLGTPTPHFWGRPDLPQALPALYSVSRYGWLGVEAFFLISGFAICLSCWGRTPVQFTVSRIARLFPLYWSVLVLIVALGLSARLAGMKPGTPVDVRTVLGNLTMAPGPLGLATVDGVAWTLWVEARFYLLMMALLLVGLTYRRAVAFCGGWLTLAAIGRELHSTVLDEFLLTQYAGLFVAGIALYLIHRFGHNLALWLLVGFAWCYTLTVLAGRVAEHTAAPGRGGAQSWGVSAALLTAFLLLLALAATGPLARLRTRWLVFAGALTYPFYLVHQSLGIPVVRGLLRAVPALGLLPSIVLGLLFSLLLAALLNRVVDAPLGRLLRRRLTRDLAPRGGPAPLPTQSRNAPALPAAAGAGAGAGVGLGR